MRSTVACSHPVATNRSVSLDEGGAGLVTDEKHHKSSNILDCKVQGIYLKTGRSIQGTETIHSCSYGGLVKYTVCSFGMSLNFILQWAGLTPDPPTPTLSRPLHCLPASQNLNATFLLVVQTEVFHFATVSKSILNTKAGVLMAVRMKPLINKGTRAVQEALFCSCARTCAPRGWPWLFLPGQKWCFFS